MRARRALSLVLGVALAAVPALVVSPSAHADAGGAVVARGGARLDPAVARDLAALPGTAPYVAFAHFGGSDAHTRRQVLTDHGLQVANDYASVAVSLAVGTVADFRGLTRAPSVTYLEANETLHMHGDTAPWATRTRDAQLPVGDGPYVDAAGRTLDGTGVGVAVIDSGIDGTHPDFAGRIGGHYKVLCATPVLIVDQEDLCSVRAMARMSTSEGTGGHGTHVAGIVAGDGAASKGTFRGVAPGATLYGFSIGETISTMFGAEAFDYIIDNYDTFVPRIKVVNNSWGEINGADYDPEDVVVKLARALISKGVTITWSAGNAGGNGSADVTGSASKEPMPGLISVANYNDANLGSRSGTLSGSSSRGESGVPTTYPDVSAPGSLIVSTCSPSLPVCYAGDIGATNAQWLPYYFNMSGTSMAAPHVAGAVAILLQARPDLTPAAIEELIQDTAHKFGAAASYTSDPQNPGGTTSFDKGAGLLDVKAALDALGVRHLGGDQRDTPSIEMSSPAPGTVSDGTAPLVAAGTLDTGFSAAPVSTSTVIATDPADDYPGSGAADLEKLVAVEEATGVRYVYTLRNRADAKSLGVEIRLLQIVNGARRTTGVGVTSTGVRIFSFNASTNNAVATEAKFGLAPNTVEVFVPFTALGNPAPGTVGRSVNVLSYDEVAGADSLPGTTNAERQARTEYGAPYIARSRVTTPPAAEVRVSVDGGAEQSAVLAGTGRELTWTSTAETTDLADGDHTVAARLYLDGVRVDETLTSIVVTRPREDVHTIAIDSPADGALLDRTLTTFSGTASTTAPASAARAVTVQVSGIGYDSGELDASGVSSWSRVIDLDLLPAGDYLVTARLRVDGVAVTEAVRRISVKAPVVLVSCNPKGLSFWQDQFNGSRKAVFTSAEAAKLASHAAASSEGYFADGQSVINLLYVKGKVPAEATAARPYAVLLLNRAAGDLSATMSAQVGLSGREALSTRTYDTSRVGTTVAAATSWVRAQLPSGDLAGANEVATALSAGTGLSC